MSAPDQVRGHRVEIVPTVLRIRRIHAPRAEHSQERLLHDVVGRGGVARRADHICPEPPCVRLVQGTEVLVVHSDRRDATSLFDVSSPHRFDSQYPTAAAPPRPTASASTIAPRIRGTPPTVNAYPNRTTPRGSRTTLACAATMMRA